MRTAEDRFRRLFDRALTGQLLVARDGSVIRVNSTLVEVLGREPAELVGLPLAAIFTDDADERRVVDLIEAGDGELTAEMTLSDADGRSLRGLVALSWMRELGDERILLAQIEDITARRDAERRLTGPRPEHERGGAVHRSRRVIVSASVGIARIDLSRETDALPDELLRRADVAMYRAKESGGDRHETFKAPRVTAATGR